MNNLQSKLDCLGQKIEARSQSMGVLLPTWQESKRGTPNGFLRSALFSAIQSKDRVWVKDALLASQGGVSIRFTGEQLNQEDLTLWEALVHLSKEKPLGYICEFTAYQILKSLQINTGKAEYDRLEKGIDRLTACQVKITFNGKTFSRSLIIGYEKLEATSHYRLELSRESPSQHRTHGGIRCYNPMAIAVPSHAVDSYRLVAPDRRSASAALTSGAAYGRTFRYLVRRNSSR